MLANIFPSRCDSRFVPLTRHQPPFILSLFLHCHVHLQGAKPVKDSRVALGDYRVEKALDPQATGAPTTAAATVLKLVPTTGGVTRTYELRFPMAVAASLSNDVTMAELDAWHAAFTGQIAAAVAAGQGGSSFSTEYGSPSSAADV